MHSVHTYICTYHTLTSFLTVKGISVLIFFNSNICADLARFGSDLSLNVLFLRIRLEFCLASILPALLMWLFLKGAASFSCNASTSFGWKYATRKKVIDHHNAAHDTNISIILPSEKVITFTYAKPGSICDNKAFQMESPRARPSLYCFISTSEFVCAMLIP